MKPRRFSNFDLEQKRNATADRTCVCMGRNLVTRRVNEEVKILYVYPSIMVLSDDYFHHALVEACPTGGGKSLCCGVVVPSGTCKLLTVPSAVFPRYCLKVPWMFRCFVVLTARIHLRRSVHIVSETIVNLTDERQPNPVHVPRWDGAKFTLLLGRGRAGHVYIPWIVESRVARHG